MFEFCDGARSLVRDGAMVSWTVTTKADSDWREFGARELAAFDEATRRFKAQNNTETLLAYTKARRELLQKRQEFSPPPSKETYERVVKAYVGPIDG